MLRDYVCPGKVYIACGHTDLRKGIDSLAILVQEYFGERIKKNDLFLFCGRRSDRIKGLLWEGDGFLLVYKRLERGNFRWPRSREDIEQISPEQYAWLMSGMEVFPRKIKVTDSPPDLY